MKEFDKKIGLVWVSNVQLFYFNAQGHLLTLHWSKHSSQSLGKRWDDYAEVKCVKARQLDTEKVLFFSKDYNSKSFEFSKFFNFYLLISLFQPSLHFILFCENVSLTDTLQHFIIIMLIAPEASPTYHEC